MALFDEVFQALKGHFDQAKNYDPKEAGADYQLNQAGSVMGSHKQGERETLANQGPLMATVMQLLQGGGLDPTNGPGGAGKAMISPGNWATTSPETKAMLTNFGNKFPGMLEKVLASAPEIMTDVTKNLPPGAAGRLQKAGPIGHRIQVRPDYAKETGTIGHELQHSLNAPRVTGTNPLDALTIATLLRDVQPGGSRGSLDALLKQALETPGAGARTLTMLTGKMPPPVANPKAPAGLMRAAMDEGLAYTAQNAANPRTSSPLLKDLAKNLGINWE